jgi:hypothetical protein
MRAFIFVLSAGILAAACSSTETDDGSAGKAPVQVNLRITTTGSGAVRGAGADCRGTCTAQYPAGSAVHLAATADSSATFAGWGGACAGTGGCDLTLDSDRDVSASFVPSTPPPPPPPPPPEGQHRLTVVVQGKGRVTSSPAGLDCDSATCTADFPSGTSVALAATASSGFNFDGWGAGCSGAGGCSVRLSSDSSVYANFTAVQPPPPPPPPPPPAQVHLTAAVTGPGTVTGAGLNCGESSPVCDVTVASGTAVTLTAAPAGKTRFAAWGGACSGTATTCQLTVRSDTKITAEFQSEMLVLAPNDGTNGATLAVNPTHVFWQRYQPGGNEIWSISKNGAGAARVTNGYVQAMVADDSYLYWTDGGNIYSTPVGGGEVALLFSGSLIGKLALDETGALYWAARSSSGENSGSIHRMQSRADAVLAKAVSPLGAVAVDATHVYFTNYSGQGTIRRVPRAGGTVETVLACGTECFPDALRLDSQALYYRISWSRFPPQSGAVQRMSKSESKVTTLSTGNGDGAFMYGMEIEVNDSVAYWNWTGGHAPYGIFSANADGTGFRGIATSNETAWLGLRVDDVAVYYWHAGAIIRILK